MPKKEPTHLPLKPGDPKACIRDPRSRVRLPPYGGLVPNNRYWRARRKDEDCVDTTPEKIAEGVAAAALERKKAADAAKSEDKAPDDVKPSEPDNTKTPSRAKRGR